MTIAQQGIPDAALDDRLGFVGMTGSGKTFGAGTCVERILHNGGRVIIPDPLGVWWGLRLLADGKTASPYNVVIFGGPHADLPITPLAGALIGEAVAGMRESAIIDLSEFETAASERKFMLAFLDALYRKATREPVHVVFDEADLWAPERILDREGSAQHLHGMMQTVVRRGRVKGLTSWLITQRPASLAKSVLSQVSGLVAFQLTASQDRKALGAWIEGQADKDEGKAILDRLPTKTRGEAVVWLPARGVLADVQFPMKHTFDSSRAPERGEKRKRTAELSPIDLGALKERMATVEAEVKANDPKALRAEIATLRKQILIKSPKATPAADPKAIADAERRGRERGASEAVPLWFARGVEATINALKSYMKDFDVPGFILKEIETWKRVGVLDRLPSIETAAPRVVPRPEKPKPRANGHDGVGLSGSELQMLKALAWWSAMGHEAPTRVQVATICGWRVTSGHVKNIAGSLRTAGFIEYPGNGTMALTEAGKAAAPAPDLSASLEESVLAVLDGSQRQVFKVLPIDGRELPRDQVATACGWEPTSGHVKNVLGNMRSLQVIDYPRKGYVALAPWIATS